MGGELINVHTSAHGWLIKVNGLPLGWRTFDVSDGQYHTSKEWLQPVYDKIKKIRPGLGVQPIEFKLLDTTSLDGDLEIPFLRASDFVEWCNQYYDGL